jgi:hypothetical protein
VWPDETGLTAAAEDPVYAPNTPRFPVRPGPAPGSPHAAEYA